MIILFFVITFEPILGGFLRVWTIQKSKMVGQDGSHSEMVMQKLHHVTSQPHNEDVKGDIFKHTIYPSSVTELRRGEGGGNPSPAPFVEHQKCPV